MAIQIRSELKEWNVRQAWTWMTVALFILAAHSVMCIPLLHCSDVLISGAAYFAATMLLTPLVTILGARRPGISAWHWFVVLPMVVVLQWPAMNQLIGNHWRTPIELSAPSIMGIIVVLAMSAGTLLGTRSTVFALSYTAGIVMLLTPITGLTWSRAFVTPVGDMLILISIWLVRRNLRNQLIRVQSSKTTLERTRAVWDLFGSLHGFAWMRRAQDRINQFGLREKWTVQLTLSGFERCVDSTDAPMGEDELQAPVEAFVWVLARFADEKWLRQTMMNPQNTKIPQDPPNLSN